MKLETRIEEGTTATRLLNTIITMGTTRNGIMTGTMTSVTMTTATMTIVVTTTGTTTIDIVIEAADHGTVHILHTRCIGAIHLLHLGTTAGAAPLTVIATENLHGRYETHVQSAGAALASIVVYYISIFKTNNGCCTVTLRLFYLFYALVPSVTV